MKLFKLRICLEVRGLAIKGAGVVKEARQKLIECFRRVDVTITPFLFRQRRKTASGSILGGCHKQVVWNLCVQK